MKHSTKIKNIFLLSVSIIFCLTSCKKFLQVNPSSSLIETNDVFSNDQTALAAVSGVYVQIRLSTTALANSGTSLYTGLSSDEIYNTSSSSTADPFFTNSLLSNNSTINTSFWASSYSNIYKINAIIEGLEASSNITDSVKIQLVGEMKIVRALYYFYLVNLFGDVPLIVSTDYQVNSTMPRIATAKIYEQIISDLKDAEGKLKTSYPDKDRARPNKWTASALLARVYLYNKDWVNAESEATSVINAGIYSLTPSAGLGNAFASGSLETIWQIASDNSNTAEASNFVPPSSTVKPTYAITNFLLNTFEVGDLRKTAWLGKNTVNGQDFYYPFKYKNKSTAPITEYEIVLRLAELYLVRAEARVQQEEANAVNDLNVIRNRAGLPDYSGAIDKDSLLAAIAHERQTELFSEWGHRWLDLKRTNTIDAVLGTEKGSNWQPYDAFYPIPFAQLQLDVYLTQNPGY